jgi:hypothetical protein
MRFPRNLGMSLFNRELESPVFVAMPTVVSSLLFILLHELPGRELHSQFVLR